jgi:LysM repeat protein
MTTGYFGKNASVMKPILLLAILSMGFPVAGASAATELETLRARCIEQERQIQVLEAQLEKLQPSSTKPAAPIAASSPAAAIPVATVVEEPTAAPAGKTHKIQPNETYSSISRKYSVSIEALLAANPGVKPTALRPGKTIQLPSEAPSSKSQPAPVDPAPAVEKNQSASTATPSPAGKAPSGSSANASSAKKIRSIMIETEMTYASFATQHGTDTGRLNDLNGLDLTDATVLAKGSELYVPQ